MSEITHTDGTKHIFVDMCDCGLTGGCEKCNPFKEFWKEDIEMAEQGMDEYCEGLRKIDGGICPEHKVNPKESLCEDLIQFYKKKGYKGG